MDPGKLRPEDKVKLAVEMTDFCVRVCADGIAESTEKLSKQMALNELRKRIKFLKRRHFEI